ncbi:hypothetical protein [Albimonas pacifica]|uniref:N-acetyltransferase domain-containing protein n=1 Tax=Albimonas pacifica TaxID=1114924 RepID=A0A1I3LIC2_9RHOB|nr:hypothetical protein [Albimonas pacifica]SFI84457.1 hypothetical protein SAMN05216258_11042 [Albimonas pacifica]
MTIRRATAEDLPRIVEMGRENYRRVVGASGFDPEATAATVARMIASESGIVLVSDGGMIGAILTPHWSAPSRMQAIETFWFAEDGSGLALLRSMAAEARARGAAEIRFTARHSVAMTRLGYEPVEMIYRERLDV